MSDLNFTVNADTSQAQRNLQQLERNIGGVQSAFGKLGAVLGGLAIGSVVSNLFNLGNQLADLSATTNVSIQSIAGLGEALAQNSGSFDQANGAVLKFTETLGAAFEGSDKTREAFARVGVTLEDLRTLSEQDLLRKTIIGLGQITDTGTRAALTADLFGKSLRGADLAGVARNLDEITAGQDRFARAAAVAGEVNQSLQNSFRVFQQELLAALEPLAELARELTNNREAIRDFIDMLISLGKAFLAVYAARAVSNILLDFSSALRKARMSGEGLGSLLSRGLGINELSRGLGQIGKAFGIFTGHTLSSRTATGKLYQFLGFLAGGFKRLIPIVGTAYAAFEVLNFAIKRLTGDSILGWLDRAGKAVANFFGIAYQTEKEKQALADETARKQEEADKEREAAANRQLQDGERAKRLAEERAREEARITEAYKSQLSSLRDSMTAYSRANEASQRRLRQEIELIGLTDKQRDLKQAAFDIEETYLRELTRLQDLYNEKSSSGKREDMRLLPDIQRAMEQLTAEYQAQLGPVQQLIEQKYRALEADKQRLELERQINDLAEFTNRSRLDAERQLRDIQADIAKSTMTSIEQKYYDIARAAEETARSQIEAENSRRRSAGMLAMTKAEEQSYYDAAVANVERLQAAEQRRYDNSRSFNTGWRKAFNEYVENATNAAQRAERMFKKATQGMEDAIVNFAKTGKFEWKGFLNSILEELLRSQIQQTIASIFGGIGGTRSSGGSGSLILGGLKSLGSLLGFANGGVIPTNGPVIVGERGPEILTGAAGRTVIPNEQAFGGANITYNINAVDAMSFKQMIASDPTFLYAVTEQGRRRLPGAR